MSTFFQLSFHNIFGFAIAFIPACITLVLLIYILFFLPRNKLVNIFALFTLAGFLWQVDDTMVRVSNTAATADAWDSLCCFGWTFIGSLGLHFSLLYSRFLRVKKVRIISILIYAPSLFFVSLYQLHIYPHVFIYNPFWGWVTNYDASPVIIIHIYLIAAMIIAATIILFYNTYRVRKNIFLYNQSLLIASGIAIPAIVGIITQAIIPTVTQYHSIPVTSTFISVFSIATVISLRNYKLFRPSELVDNETMIESLPVIIFSVAENKQITYINTQGKKILGISSKTNYEIAFDQFFHFGSVPYALNVSNAWEEALKGNSTNFIESSFITSEGEIFLLLSANPIINNQSIQGVLFVGREITELKKSQQLIVHQKYLLNEAQQIAHVGSWEWDIIRDKVTWSDEMYRIYGYTPQQMTVSYKKFLEIIHPDELDNIKNIIETSLAEKKPYSFYHRVVRPDGSEAVLFAIGNISTDAENKVIRLHGTVQDVTELKKQEEILQNQNKELKKINAELDRFVYSVSHDLRAPLTSMLGVIDIAEDDTKEPATLQYLTMLKSSIHKLDKFILDILDYSRNSRIDIQADEVNWQELLHDIMQHQFPAAPIQLRYDIEKQNGTIFRSDKDRISIILNNLISNAIRYRDIKKQDAYVHIHIAVNPTYSIIEVSDNGMGIHRQMQGRVFEMFFRASKNAGGSGLGLYIVKETVEKLKGTIVLESAPEKGSTFKITIPNLQ